MDILIVEDEVRLAEAVAHILRSAGHRVDVVHDGISGFEYGQNGVYDAIILDHMLPGMEGFDIARQLRRKDINTPILMLTALASTADKVQGLDCGADDYMTKPFENEELLARIRAITRRHGDVILDEITFSGLSLNLTSRELSYNGKNVNLSQKEFEVMHYLMLNSGQIVTKENLIAKVWGVESDAVDNNVEAYISFLRKKLDFLDSPTTITTIRKLGYKLTE